MKQEFTDAEKQRFIGRPELRNGYESLRKKEIVDVLTEHGVMAKNGTTFSNMPKSSLFQVAEVCVTRGEIPDLRALWEEQQSFNYQEKFAEVSEENRQLVEDVETMKEQMAAIREQMAAMRRDVGPEVKTDPYQPINPTPITEDLDGGPLEPEVKTDPINPVLIIDAPSKEPWPALKARARDAGIEDVNKKKRDELESLLEGK